MSFHLRCAIRVWSCLAVLVAMGVPASVTLALSPSPLLPPLLEIPTPVESPVTLQSVTIQTEINGSLALTSVEMAFFNPNHRWLEGALQFPLLDGQSIVGFALEVDGKLREAVPVEKARGQAVFEDITRGRIDPGLMHVTQGNNFQLRVYPILPGKPKWVMIRYAERLPVRNGRQLYRLPLVYGNERPAFALHLRVNGADTKPLVVQNAVMPVAFRRKGDRYSAE